MVLSAMAVSPIYCAEYSALVGNETEHESGELFEDARGTESLILSSLQGVVIVTGMS